MLQSGTIERKMTPAEQVLEAMYAASSEDGGIDIIMDAFHDWAETGQKCNCEEVLEKADFSKLSTQLVYSLAATSHGLSSGFLCPVTILDNHKEYAERAYNEVKKREGIKKAHDLLKDLIKVPDGYKSMSQLLGVEITPTNNQQVFKREIQ